MWGAYLHLLPFAQVWKTLRKKAENKKKTKLTEDEIQQGEKKTRLQRRDSDWY